MANKSDRPLTNKQLAFCREYCVDSNGQAAMERAGYKPKTARITASQYLTQPNIMQEVDRIRAELATKVEMTVAKVQAMYQEAYDLAKDQANPNTNSMNGSITGIARLYGMDKDTVNTNVDQPDTLTPEQADDLRRMARVKLIRDTGEAKQA